MNFKDIVGKTIESIDQQDERIVFYFTDGTAAESVHHQDCCECVAVDRVDGNLADIIGQPITEAEEIESDDNEPPMPPGHTRWTWTRQRIKTSAGQVSFVWLGTSNGYYGETPTFQITHGKSV